VPEECKVLAKACVHHEALRDVNWSN